MQIKTAAVPECAILDSRTAELRPKRGSGKVRDAEQKEPETTPAARLLQVSISSPDFTRPDITWYMHVCSRSFKAVFTPCFQSPDQSSYQEEVMGSSQQTDDHLLLQNKQQDQLVVVAWSLSCSSDPSRHGLHKAGSHLKHARLQQIF